MNSIRIQEINMFKSGSCSSKTTANGMPIILLKLFVYSSAEKPSGASDQNPPIGDVNFLLKRWRGKRIIYFKNILSIKLVNIIIHWILQV